MATQHEKKQLALGIDEREEEHQVLFAITELIGQCNRWPSWVAKIFWSQTINNANSIRLLVFLLGNGLPRHLMYQWLHVRGVKFNLRTLQCTEKAVRKEMEVDTTACTSEATVQNMKFFYFDMVEGEYCFANGLPRNNLGGVASIKAPKAIERHITQAGAKTCEVCGLGPFQAFNPAFGGRRKAKEPDLRGPGGVGTSTYTHAKCKRIS